MQGEESILYVGSLQVLWLDIESSALLEERREGVELNGDDEAGQEDGLEGLQLQKTFN